VRWAEPVARIGEIRDAYRILIGKSEVKRPLGKLMHKWEDNIKMDLNVRGLGLDLNGPG
jgi:hypothetical protein